MPRIGLETFGEALAGCDRPFVLASGLLGLAPERVATERDGHRPDSSAAPLIGGAQTRLATAADGALPRFARRPLVGYATHGAPSDTPDYLRDGMRGPVRPGRWSGSTRAFLAPRCLSQPRPWAGHQDRLIDQELARCTRNADGGAAAATSKASCARGGGSGWTARLAEQVATPIDWAATLEALIESASIGYWTSALDTLLADMMHAAFPTVPSRRGVSLLEGVRRWMGSA